MSPRSNMLEPCARGRTSTSADSGRMSFGPRPSSRTPCSITRARMTFFCRSFHAGEISACARGERLVAPASRRGAPSRASLSSSSAGLALGLRRARSRSRGRSFANASTSSPGVLAVERAGLERPRLDVELGSRNSSWNSIISAIARFAASRPCATTSSVGATAPSAARAAARCCRAPRPRSSGCRSRPASLRRPATTMSNVASSISWNVGLTTHSPSIRPSRTEPTGPVERDPADASWRGSRRSSPTMS